MKYSWLFAVGLLLGGCSNTSNIANLDGFWCDLTGAPATFVQGPLPLNETPAFPRNCLRGDYEVPMSSVCLVDNPGCYQLDNGAWCSAAQAPNS